MRGYYNDAAQFNPSLRNGGKSYENVYGPGSMDYSERVMQSYMNRYATVRRLGRRATDEDIARIHNGGPNGYRNPNTLQYWRKVQSYLPLIKQQGEEKERLVKAFLRYLLLQE